jgi:hypothetical protein
MFALGLGAAGDPREEVTEEDVIYDSTLVAPARDEQRRTTITKVERETSDEN